MSDNKQIMTPDHERWDEFKGRLSGPEGCNMRTDDNTENIIWDCAGGKDKSFAIAILKTIPEVDLEGSLEYFEEHGGFCDCEILMNVDCVDNEGDEGEN